MQLLARCFGALAYHDRDVREGETGSKAQGKEFPFVDGESGQGVMEAPDLIAVYDFRFDHVWRDGPENVQETIFRIQDSPVLATKVGGAVASDAEEPGGNLQQCLCSGKTSGGDCGKNQGYRKANRRDGTEGRSLRLWVPSLSRLPEGPVRTSPATMSIHGRSTGRTVAGSSFQLRRGVDVITKTPGD